MIAKYQIRLVALIGIIIFAVATTFVFKLKTAKNPRLAPTDIQTGTNRLGEAQTAPLLEKRILNPVLINSKTVRFISSLANEFQDFDLNKNQIIKNYPIKNLINPDRLFYSPDFTKVLIFDATLTNAATSKILLYDFTAKKEKWLDKDIINANFADNNTIYFYSKENGSNAIYKANVKGKSNKQKILDITEPGTVTPYPAKAGLVLYIESNQTGMIKVVDLANPSESKNIPGDFGLPRLSPDQTEFIATKDVDNQPAGFIAYNLSTQNMTEFAPVLSPNKIWFAKNKNSVYLAKPVIDKENNILISESLVLYNLETKKETDVLADIDGNKFIVDDLLNYDRKTLYLIAGDFLYKISLPSKI